jgi:hypothetical protein
MGYSEDELRRVVHDGELGCQYEPSPSGLTMYDWMRRLRDLLAA